MASRQSPPIRRFRGVLVWFEAEGHRARRGRIERALLRPDRLSLELTTGGQPYTVTLQRHEGLLQGTWSRGAGPREKTGPAECELAPCGETIGRRGDHNLKLEGTWFEDGQWDWVGRLLPIAPPPDPDRPLPAARHPKRRSR
jgi:hypothetical protein